MHTPRAIGLGAPTPHRHGGCAAVRGLKEIWRWATDAASVLPISFCPPLMKLLLWLKVCCTDTLYGYMYRPCTTSCTSFHFIGLYIKQAQLCFFSFFFFNAHDKLIPLAGTSCEHSIAVGSGFPTWCPSVHICPQQCSIYLQHRALGNEDNPKITERPCSDLASQREISKSPGYSAISSNYCKCLPSLKTHYSLVSKILSTSKQIHWYIVSIHLDWKRFVFLKSERNYGQLSPTLSGKNMPPLL